jgi:hypothetical protein
MKWTLFGGCRFYFQATFRAIASSARNESVCTKKKGGGWGGETITQLTGQVILREVIVLAKSRKEANIQCQSIDKESQTSCVPKLPYPLSILQSPSGYPHL